MSLHTGVKGRKGFEKGAFSSCKRLRHAHLPMTLKVIGYRSFAECTALLHVNIPFGVTELGERAFIGCQSLRQMDVPEGIVHLPERIFSGCTALETVKLPMSLRSIGCAAFSSCSSITSINFASLEGVTEIGSSAFACCSSIASFTFPPNVKRIETLTLRDGISLLSVLLPPHLEHLEKGAFRDCHRDLCIKVPDTNTKEIISKVTRMKKIHTRVVTLNPNPHQVVVKSSFEMTVDEEESDSDQEFEEEAEGGDIIYEGTGLTRYEGGSQGMNVSNTSMENSAAYLLNALRNSPKKY